MTTLSEENQRELFEYLMATCERWAAVADDWAGIANEWREVSRTTERDTRLMAWMALGCALLGIAMVMLLANIRWGWGFGL